MKSFSKTFYDINVFLQANHLVFVLGGLVYQRKRLKSSRPDDCNKVSNISRLSRIYPIEIIFVNLFLRQQCFKICFFLIDN